jgi:hypothetical protein
VTGLGLDGYRDLGRRAGLAAGLAAVLDGLDPAEAAPQGVAVLPATGVPRGARVVPHALAAREGLAVVRFPPSGAPPARGLAGARAAELAAVRLGVLTRLLDAAVRRLENRHFAGVPLIKQQLVVGAVADVVTALELAAATTPGTDPADAADQHERLTSAGWTVARFFGAEGYVADHPARALHVSTLVADVWVPRHPDRQREE